MTCKLEATNFDKNLKLVIETYENFGTYLLVYDLSSGKCIKDHLYSEDQLDGVYNHAKNVYGVDKDSFHLATE